MEKLPTDHTPSENMVRYHLFWKGKAAPVRIKFRLNFIEAQRQILSGKKKTKAVVGMMTALVLSVLIWWALALIL